MNISLDSLLTQARHNMVRRDQDRVEKTGMKELRSIVLPVIKNAVDVAEKAITCAEKSAERYEEFSLKYPFHDFTRTGPAFVLLASCLRNLEHLSHQKGLDLVKWVDFGPFNARKLAGFDSYFSPSSEKVLFDESDVREADRAFRDMQIDLVNDVKPVLDPLEKFALSAHEVWKQSQDILNKYEKLGFKLVAGEALASVGFSESCMTILILWPGFRDLLERSSMDSGLWLRSGQPKKIWPGWMKNRFVQVRSELGIRWIPVDQLKDFVAGK